VLLLRRSGRTEHVRRAPLPSSRGRRHFVLPPVSQEPSGYRVRSSPEMLCVREFSARMPG